MEREKGKRLATGRQVRTDQDRAGQGRTGQAEKRDGTKAGLGRATSWDEIKGFGIPAFALPGCPLKSKGSTSDSR